MASASPQAPAPLAPETIAFYREAMDAFDEAGVPFLVGGAYTYARYTGIVRTPRTSTSSCGPPTSTARSTPSTAKAGGPSAPSPTGSARATGAKTSWT